MCLRFPGISLRVLTLPFALRSAFMCSSADGSLTFPRCSLFLCMLVNCRKMADDGNQGLVSPCSAGDLKKGVIGMFKGRPAKVTEVSISKTGKHGHAKCSIIAVDIFTNKKISDVQPSHAHMYMANVTKKEYQVMSIDQKEKSVSVLDEDNNTVDLNLEGESAEDLAANYDPEDNDNVYIVTVTTAPIGKGDAEKAEWEAFDAISAWKKVKADSV